MKLKQHSYFLVILFSLGMLALSFTSCKTGKQIQAAITKKDTTTLHITNQSASDSLMVIRKTINDLSKNHTIKFKWVKGHADNFYNTRCDQLATEAADAKNLLIDKGYESEIKS